MYYETQHFNIYLNGLKTDISNDWIKWVALYGNWNNTTLSSDIKKTDFIIVMAATAIINQEKRVWKRTRNIVSK